MQLDDLGGRAGHTHSDRRLLCVECRAAHRLLNVSVAILRERGDVLDFVASVAFCTAATSVFVIL